METLGRILVRSEEVFHWHREAFTLPEEAVGLVRSRGCAHQAFRLGDRVLGIQFHLEMTPEGAEQLIQMCPDDLDGEGPYVQSPTEILARPDRFARSHEVLEELLDQFLED